MLYFIYFLPFMVNKDYHFAFNYRPTRGRISPCNIAGLISNVSEEVATLIAKNCRRRQPQRHLTRAGKTAVFSVLIKWF